MRSIWVVATNTIKQALRMKIALVFIIGLLVCLPAMGLSMTGDGTLKGRLQTFVSYGLSLTSFLLCLLTIIVSIYSLTSDIEQKQIYTVVTKPIRRFQILLGKLLGVVLLDAALLIGFCALIYGITIYIPRYLDAGEDELACCRNEFFTARVGLTAPEADVRQEVLAHYKKLRETGQLQGLRDLSRKEIIAEITRRKQLANRAAAVGRSLLWEFNNVKVSDPNLFIRYKYDVSVNPPDLHVWAQWVVGDLRQIRFATKKETPIYTFTPRNPIRTFCEVEVPADAVAADGYLGVQFINLPINNTPVIFGGDGLEILYKADTFGANFLRAAGLLLLRLIFLACLGILASSFLSFPVAILLCLVIFFTATVSTFVIDSFNYITAELSGVYSYAVKPIVQLLPQFDKFNPAKSLVSGRLLSWQLLATAAGLMVCIKALLLLLLALLIFRYKEIAKIVI